MVKVNFATDIKNLDQLNRNCKRASLDDVTELLLVMYGPPEGDLAEASVYMWIDLFGKLSKQVFCPLWCYNQMNRV